MTLAFVANPTRSRRHQITQFFVHVLFVVHGLGDFAANQFTIPLAEPMGGHLHRAFAHRQPIGDLGVWRLASGKGWLQFVEQRRLSTGSPFRPQACQDLLKKRQRPPTIKYLFRSHALHRLNPVAGFGGLGIQGEKGSAAAALLGVGAIPFVGQEVLDARQKEGSKPAFFAGDAIEPAFFKKQGEERLGQVLGIVRIVPLASNKGVDRVPVICAEIFQGIPRRRLIAARGKDDAPPRHLKSPAGGGGVLGNCHVDVVTPGRGKV